MALEIPQATSYRRLPCHSILSHEIRVKRNKKVIIVSVMPQTKDMVEQNKNLKERTSWDHNLGITVQLNMSFNQCQMTGQRRPKPHTLTLVQSGIQGMGVPMNWRRWKMGLVMEVKSYRLGHTSLNTGAMQLAIFVGPLLSWDSSGNTQSWWI